MAEGRPHKRRPLRERFEEKVRIEGSCWIWTATITKNGYGQFVLPSPRRTVLAHRLSYEMSVGPIPDGLVIDHLCRRRACVNPQHLQPVTTALNIARGESPGAIFRRTGRCMRDHTDTYRGPNGRMHCRPCDNARLAKYRSKPTV